MKKHTGINMHSRFVYFVACFIIMAGCLSGCQQNVDSGGELPEITESEITEIDDKTDIDEDLQEIDLSESPDEYKIYDFSVLSDDEFLSGTCTVNQLIDKYGTPIECHAWYPEYLVGYKYCSINVVFEGIIYGFYFTNIEQFSFYEENLPVGEYYLSSKDYDIELNILGILITGSDHEESLPFDIRIDNSTKKEIIDYYDSTPHIYYNDYLELEEYTYDYAYYNDDGTFTDEYEHLKGFITYRFDENGMLKNVLIQWHYSDL